MTRKFMIELLLNVLFKVILLSAKLEFRNSPLLFLVNNIICTLKVRTFSNEVVNCLI